MSERIAAAALRLSVPDRLRQAMWNGQRVYPDHLIVTAPPPARHGTLLHPVHEMFAPVGPNDQGFITDTGRFVDRVEGLKDSPGSRADHQKDGLRRAPVQRGSLVMTTITDADLIERLKKRASLQMMVREADRKLLSEAASRLEGLVEENAELTQVARSLLNVILALPGETRFSKGDTIVIVSASGRLATLSREGGE